MSSAVDYNKSTQISKREWRDIQRVLNVTADGIPGPKTTAAVVEYQKHHGLEADGKVGPLTLGTLRAEMQVYNDVLDLEPDNSDVERTHTIPPLVSRWRYDHAELARYPYLDMQWNEVCGTGSWLAAMFLLVSGYRKHSGKVSRGLDSWISLDTFSIWVVHYWAGTASDPLSVFCRKHPDLAYEAWGENAVRMKDPQWLRTVTGTKRGKMPHNPELDWLLAGWWKVSRHPACIEVFTRHWTQSYPRKARATARKLGWDRHLGARNGGQIYAALTRMHNSGGVMRRINKARAWSRAGELRALTSDQKRWMQKAKASEIAAINKALRQARSGDPLDVLRAAYMLPRKWGGYGKPKRWKKITSWNGFKGPAPVRLDVRKDLNLNASPRRHNGEPVTFEGVS